MHLLFYYVFCQYLFSYHSIYSYIYQQTPRNIWLFCYIYLWYHLHPRSEDKKGSRYWTWIWRGCLDGGKSVKKKKCGFPGSHFLHYLDTKCGEKKTRTDALQYFSLIFPDIIWWATIFRLQQHHYRFIVSWAILVSLAYIKWFQVFLILRILSVWVMSVLKYHFLLF